MAYLWLTIVVMTMIGVNADPKPSNNPFQGFPFQQMPLPKKKKHLKHTTFNSQFPTINFPNIQIPTFPTFPNFPQFTPIFPTIPPIPPIKIPTPEEIINKNVDSNEQFNGIIVQSSSNYVKDKDGKLVKTGGTTVVTNNNGDVQKFSVGNAPPVVKINPVPPFKHPEITIGKGMIPVLQPLPLFFPPIQPKLTYYQLKNIKPGKNQAFVGGSTSSFTVSSNVNGKKQYAGATKIIVNDNGKIDEQTVALEKNSI